MKDKKDPFIFELSGLPGSGKSTVIKQISKILKKKPLFLTKHYKETPYKFIISIPFIPFILLKFYRVTKILYNSKFKNLNSFVSLKVKLSIIVTLSICFTEYVITKTEARLRRKIVLLDGGFIQWGLAIWLRTPPEIQIKVWEAYISHIPNNILCIIIDCSPNEAIKRAKMRNEGIPSVFMTRPWSNKDLNYLNIQYTKLYDLIKNQEIKFQASCMYISSLDDSKTQANCILGILEKILPLNKIVTN